MTEPHLARSHHAALVAALASAQVACASAEPAQPAAPAVGGTHADLVALFSDNFAQYEGDVDAKVLAAIPIAKAAAE